MSLLKGMCESEGLYEIFSNTINEYKMLENIEKIIFLFSGGKDATLGLYFMDKYIKEKQLNVKLEALMVTYPKHVYYLEDESEAECFIKTKEFWNELGVDLKVFDSDQEDLKDGEIRGCRICKGARKQIVDTYLDKVSKESKTAVVTGYTLYDVLAYLDEISLVSNYNFNINELKEQNAINRIQNCLHKMKAKEELPNGLTIIRPLICMHEDDIMDVIKKAHMPYINRPCKVSDSKHKREYFKVLNTVGTINNVSYKGVLDFLDKVSIELPYTFTDIEYENYFTDC